MMRDGRASELSPRGWSVWTDGRGYQAIQDGAVPAGAAPPKTRCGPAAWGPRRKQASRALWDAWLLAVDGVPPNNRAAFIAGGRAAVRAYQRGAMVREQDAATPAKPERERWTAEMEEERLAILTARGWSRDNAPRWDSRYQRADTNRDQRSG